MYDDFLVHNWELASLIYEQSKLTSKATALTPDEERLFRVRGKRIEQLLKSITSGRPADGKERWRTPPVIWMYLN